MINILFVCTGNISRSFLAERLLKNEMSINGVKNVAVTSVGVAAYPDTPGDPEMVVFLKKMGIYADGHKARMITKKDVDWADIVLVMEKGHKETIEKKWPEEKEKIHLLGRYISSGQIVDDILDPFGKSLYHYRAAQSQITLAVRSLLKQIISDRIGQADA